MRREVSTGRKRASHPYDWCVDESWVAWQMFVTCGRFQQEKDAGEAIWDPSVGSGRTMVTFAENGFDVFGSDIVNRVDLSLFMPEAVSDLQYFSADFLEVEKAPTPCSIVCNPPYSYIDGIAEAFVRHALKLTSRRVCAVLPIKWLGSQGRYRLFREEFPPQAVLVHCQRPSMPPGDMIDALAAVGRDFKGGVIDYAWFVWNVLEPTAPNETRVVWMPPLSHAAIEPVEWLAQAGGPR